MRVMDLIAELEKYPAGMHIIVAILGPDFGEVVDDFNLDRNGKALQITVSSERLTPPVKRKRK